MSWVWTNSQPLQTILLFCRSPEWTRPQLAAARRTTIPMADEILEFTWGINVGEDAADEDPFNPLSRAFRVLLNEGRPYQGHSLCYFQDTRENPIGLAPLRWLGVVLISEGDRVIFFPGQINPVDWLETTSVSEPRTRRDFQLDHLSLEPHRQRWHFTTTQSIEHAAGGRTPEVGDERLLWFGFSLNSESALRPVRWRTIVRYPSPPSDIMRRLEFLRDAEHRSSHSYVRQSEGARDRFAPGFLHFTFVIGPRSAPDYRGPEWLAPFQSPYLEDPLPDMISDLQIRNHRIELADRYDLQIACMWFPGSLSSTGLFTTKARL